MRALDDDSDSASVQLDRRFEVSPARLFRAWTDPAIVKRWFGPSRMTVRRVNIDLRVCGHWEIEMVDDDGSDYVVEGEFTEIVPPSRIAYTWLERGRPDDQRTLVTVEFRANHAGTDLHLVHDSFLSLDERDEHGRGWIALMNNLAREQDWCRSHS